MSLSTSQSCIVSVLTNTVDVSFLSAVKREGCFSFIFREAFILFFVEFEKCASWESMRVLFDICDVQVRECLEPFFNFFSVRKESSYRDRNLKVQS